MAIKQLSVSGYRSIRGVELDLQQITVLVGANGCGKTNLYRSMYLIHAAATGRLAHAFLEEGGMPSALWAGKRGKGPVRMTLGFTGENLAYELECGLPTPIPGGSAFHLDPMIKGETIHFVEGRTRTQMLERGNSSAWARDAEGRRASYPMEFLETESVLAQLREPHRFPQVSALRQEILSWRFYHHFRTDAASPIREAQYGVRTPVLSHDGRDLGAALTTIIEVGDPLMLSRHIDRAFPGARLALHTSDGRFQVGMDMPGFQRPFTAQELSDGTLRYLCLLAALLSPRPPSVLALNEPETSIHPDLMEPLAELIVEAAKSSQLWITTHSEALAGHIARLAGVQPVHLYKSDGETCIGSA